MTFPTIPPNPTAPPAAPSRADPDPTFSSKADAFVAWFAPFTTWLTNFVTFISQFITELGVVQADVTTKANNAATSATNASNSEVNALASANAAAAIVNSTATTGTSTTTLTVDYGSKSLVTQSGRGFAPGLTLRLYSAEGYQMIGVVTAYSGTNLTLDVQSASGLGNTSSTWYLGFYYIEAERSAFIWSLVLRK